MDVAPIEAAEEIEVFVVEDVTVEVAVDWIEVLCRPESEVIDRMVYGDFLALLNERDREIVVLLRSGVTKLTEIAELMG